MTSRASLNHAYRTVWNASLGAMVAVAEISRSPRSGARTGVTKCSIAAAGGGIRALALGVAFAWGMAPGHAFANPTGGVAVNGQATFNTLGNKLVVTTQNGAGQNHSTINWQSFSIPAGNTTYFQQPSASSTSINRVVTNTPSQIFGTLGSNGNLVLVNQSGITVGKDALVDTAGFTASSLSMRDADAASGRMRYGDGTAGDGGVSVLGNILVRSGDVVLLGSNVATGKDALIQAPNGTTLLAAGQQIELTGRGLEGITLQVQAPNNEAVNLGTLKGDAVGVFAGTLKHSGSIQANAVSLQGGKVVLKASDTALVGGTVSAAAMSGAGGTIRATANKIAIQSSAVLDVSANTGGGEILVGGGWQGNDASISNAEQSIVATGAQLRADAWTKGDGGTVVVWADGSTRFGGNVSARGGAEGGNGGMVEVSGKRFLDFRGSVDLSAASGRAGTLLLDPDTLEIGVTADANGDGDIANPDDLTSSSFTAPITSSGYGSKITAAAVANLLTSSSVSLTATGDITVASSISKTGGTATSLNLTSNNGSIYLNASISAAAGAGKLDVDLKAILGGVNDNSDGGARIGNLNGGRWLATVGANLITTSPEGNMLYKLGSGDFVQYNYSTGSSILGSGNGLLVASSLPKTFSPGVSTNFSKVYDGSTSLNLTGSTLAMASGLSVDGLNISSTSVTLSGAGTLSSASVGSARSINVGNISLGALDANGGQKIYGLKLGTVGYSLSASITPAQITLVGSRSYDGTRVIASDIFSISGLVNGETLAISGSGTLVDKNAATNKAFDLGSISLGNGSGSISNYTLSNSTVSILPLRIGSLGTAGLVADKVYDGNTAATLNLQSAVLGNKVAGDDLGLSVLSATFNSRDVGLGKSVALSGVSLVGADAANYSLVGSSLLVTANISRAPLTVSTSDVRKTYDGTDLAVGVPLVTAGALRGGDTIGSAVFAFADKNTGTNKTVAVIAATVADGNNGQNYAITYANNTASSITAAPLTLNVNAVNKVYDGSVNAQGTLAITSGQLFGTDVLNGGTLAFDNKNAGTNKTVTISGTSIVDGNNGQNYAITYINNRANITAAPLTLNVNAVNKVYDGLVNAQGTLAITSGQLFGTDALNAGTLAFDNRNVGTNKTLTISGTSIVDGNNGQNYAITYINNRANITAAPLTLNVNAVNKVYDGSANAQGTLAITSGQLFGTDVLNSGTLAFDNKNAGTNKTLTISGTSIVDGNNGQNYAITYINNKANITAAPLTLSVGAVNKVYDGTTGAQGTLTASGLKATDTVSGGTFAFDNKNVGTNKTVSASGATVADGNNGQNYAITYANNATSTITAAPLTISTTAVNKVYDGTTGAQGTLTASGLKATDTVSGGTFAFDNKNAGAGKTVTVGGATVLDGNNGQNYAVTYANNATSSITAAALTLSASALSKVYDGTTSAQGTLAASGLVGSDTVSGGVLAFSNKNAGTNKTVSASSATVADGNNGQNYTITYANGTANISAAPLTLSTTAVNKVYDGTTSAQGTLTASGLKATDTVNGGTLAFDNKNAGTNKTVSASGATVADGNNGQNYTITYANGTANISAAPLTLSTTAVNKVYDGTTGAQGTLTASGLKATDTVSGGTFAFDNKNAGTGKTVTVGGATVLDGNNGQNYAITYANNATSSIDAKTLKAVNSGTALVKDKAYDGSLAAELVLQNATLDGKIGTDVVGLTATGNFSNPNVGVNKDVTVAGLALSGGDANNYKLDASGLKFSGSITQLQQLSWRAGVTSGSWNDPNNWGTGPNNLAVPTGDNVKSVVGLEAANVTYSSAAGNSSVDALMVAGLSISGGALTIRNNVTTSASFQQVDGKLNVGGDAVLAQTSGSLQVGEITARSLTLTSAGAISQSGPLSGASGPTTQIEKLTVTAGGNITLNNAGNRVSNFAGSITGTGNLSFTNIGAMQFAGRTAAGNITVSNTGGIIANQTFATGGSLSLEANSPLTVGAEGVGATGDVALVATNRTSAGNLTILGNVTSTAGAVKLNAAQDFVQNGAVFGALGVAAIAGGTATFGPNAVTTGRPVSYAAAGQDVKPPASASAAVEGVTTGAGGNAPTDFVLTFLTKFDKALEQQIASSDTPGEKKKEVNGVVVEGLTCTP